MLVRPNARVVQFIAFASLLSAVLWLYNISYGIPVKVSTPIPTEGEKPVSRSHPIDVLVQQGQTQWKALLAKQSQSLEDAARKYRERRGRHPPPGFDQWYKFAKEHNAVLVEEFFDVIYDDLRPFWGVPAKDIRQQARTFEHVVAVRNKNVTTRSNHDRPWMNLWGELVGTIAEFLPDVDLAINVMDESRIVVPWEKINEYVGKEQAERKLLDPVQVITNWSGLADVDAKPGEPYNLEWTGRGPYWELARPGCHPESPARKRPMITDYSGPPPLYTEYPPDSYEGYVSNWTAAKDPCGQPRLQEVHGTFVEPISIQTSAKLFPLFGGSKLPMNNEILLPPAMYWTKDPFYSGGDSHGGDWEEKKDALIWRGSASGGRNKKENWARFQRHRFVSMVNGSSVKQAEMSSVPPPNFDLPSYSYYKLLAPRNGYLGDWVANFSDAAFVHLLCFPNEGSAYCSYTDPYYTVKDEMPMAKQYQYKYLPDLDGNSFSGRYRGFLLSSSLPIKATIYNEWHDPRLIPWVHFVPMDNTFIDIYGIMDYFLGFDGVGGHDAVAQRIAMEGKEWSEKVLREVDMQIYVWRLLLEYARVCDDERHRLGWVQDLVGVKPHTT